MHVAVSFWWLVGGDRGLFQLIEGFGQTGDPGLLQQRLLVVHDAGGHPVRDANHFPFIGRRALAAGQEVVPVPGWVARHDLVRQRLVVHHVRADPACHAD